MEYCLSVWAVSSESRFPSQATDLLAQILLQILSENGLPSHPLQGTMLSNILIPEVFRTVIKKHFTKSACWFDLGMLSFLSSLI